MSACTLNWSPAVNNVERCGGLPEEICSAAKHIMANGGGGRAQAIGAAVNFVKFVCKTGKSKNFLKSNPGHTVEPAKRARACANVAAWERLVACMRSKGGEKAGEPEGVSELDLLLLNIDMLNLADDLYLDSLGKAPIAPADELWTPPGATEDGAEPVLAEGSAKALCHAGSCGLGVHDMTDFVAELVETSGKASVEATPEGLIIRGLAADFKPDREQEAFEPGAFQKGLDEFMKNPVLSYSHAENVIDTVKGPSKYVQLGQVKSLEHTGNGVEMEAFIPKPQGQSFLNDVYAKVEAGMMKGLSVGGKFYKHYTPQGWKIYQADLQEIAVAPKPINPRTLIHTVSAAKAMTDHGVGWHPIEDLTDTLTG